MDTTNDPIKALIETTGLSCDDLLEKLLQYKSQQNKIAGQKQDNRPSDICTRNGNEKHVETTSVATERNCSSSQVTSNDCTSDLGISKSHLPQEPNVLEDSNISSGPMDSTTEKVSLTAEHEIETTRINLKNPTETQENLKTTLSQPIDTSTILETSNTSSGSKDTSTESILPLIEHEILKSSSKNIVNERQENLQTSPTQPVISDIKNRSNTSSGSDDTIIKNVSPVVEHENEISRFALNDSTNETKENLKPTYEESNKSSTSYATIENVPPAIENENEISRFALNNSTNETKDNSKPISSHYIDISKFFKESNTSCGSEDTPTENVSPASEHDDEISNFAMDSSANQTEENLMPTSSQYIDISKFFGESNTLSTSEDFVIRNDSSLDEHENDISRLVLKNTTNETQKNLKPTSSTNYLHISKTVKEINTPSGSKNTTTDEVSPAVELQDETLRFVLENDTHETQENLNPTSFHYIDISKVFKESNTPSGSEYTPTENCSSAVEYGIQIARFDLKNTSNKSQENSNITSFGSEDTKTENKNSTHELQENMNTTSPQLMDISKAFKETNTSSGSGDTTTENLSATIGCENESSKFELKNAPKETLRNLKKFSSKITDMVKNSVVCDLNSRQQEVSSEHSSIVGESKKKNIMNSDENQQSPNVSKNDEDISSTARPKSNPRMNNTNFISSNPIFNTSMNVLGRSKSISDELVQKLSERITQYDKMVDSIKDPKENDIEVCQIEEIEIAEKQPKSLLKLRTDLFANEFNGNFPPSDNEDENEENTVEMKEFLKNIEEVTVEVQKDSSVNKTLHTTEHSMKVSPRVRKVKMGFVKKRILHKAIKCINGVDAKKIEHISNKKLFVPKKPNCENQPANSSHASEEEIRKNLKLQLSSLRNRRKNDLIRDKCNLDNLIIKYDKHTFDKKKAANKITPTDGAESSRTVANESQNTLTSSTVDSSINDADSEKKESLFSLSNDTDFVIVDVQGGVEIPEMTECVETIKKAPSDLIKLTKTNDVTKIKGWQNKKFQLHHESNAEEFIRDIDINTKEIIQSDTSMPCCSKTKVEKSNKGMEEELSPFVSHSLEEFLTENSTLNISYNIPKLGAVQAINNRKYDRVIISQSECTTSESEKKEETEKPKTIKPKTLAEKRRMLEKNKQEVKRKEKIFNKKSYVLYNGHKLYVPTMDPEECLVNITFLPKPNLPHKTTNRIFKNKKLSLLDSYHQSNSCVSYKPGPLRAKQRLQNRESLLQWNTEIQRLPQIKLNVVTEVGKPIPPHLIHHFNFGPKIKEDRLELALSALSTSREKQKQGFSLTVPYMNNQKYILVRRKRKTKHDIVYDITPEKNTIASILDDLISYVENKENENSFIRNAELYEEVENHISFIKNAEVYREEENHENEIRASPDLSPTEKAKRTRLNTEIQRLSCKVLSVSFDETEDSTMCLKSFCKLGCVCRSLACVPQLPMHCAKIQCMFECECSGGENISLGVENGALTRDTVTRLEDQAKKNLAKVEKEFTQTIIHAKNKTILIPSSDRNKAKRVKRLPKRYSDFLEDFNDTKVDSSVSNNQGNHSMKISNCYVELQKLEIKGIIPLCLYHDCYNCTCMNKNHKKLNIPSENETHELAQNRIDRKRKYSSESHEVVHNNLDKKKSHSPVKKKKNKSKSKESKSMSGVSSSGNNTSDSDYTEESQGHHNKKLKEKEGCARLIGVHPEIVARNEIPFYKNKIKSKVIQSENSTSIDPASMQNISYTEPFIEEFIDVITPLTISASDRLKFLIMKNRKRRRKQTFDDVDPLHKSKKLHLDEVPHDIPHEPINEVSNNNNRSENLPYLPVFDGEIIVPTNENKDFVKKLGMKSAAQYMRLLPWNDLLRNYYSRKINIWCNDSYNKLLMNSRDIEPPEGYIEITKSKRKNGIMYWILTKSLPKQTPAELVHLILSPKREYFEISGICLKNISEREKANRVIETKIKKSEKTVSEQNNLNESKFFEHKNHKNETKLLIITQKEYHKQFLHVYRPSEPPNDGQFGPLHVRLPSFQSLRWRMLFLNSNFTFLLFEKSGYSVKYTDLMNILKKAQVSNKTICLQSKNLSKGYSQKNYGIYAVPKYVDILFIGPYEMEEDHGLQTLRYLRQELVSTTYFEMVQGGVIPNKKKDMWLISKDFQYNLNEISSKIKKRSSGNLLRSSPEKFNQNAQNSEYAVLTPLLSNSTNSSQNNNSSDLAQQNETAQELLDFHSHLFDASGNFTTSVDLEEKTFVKFPQFIILNGKILRPQDYNGYFTTNIPDFGYLGAIKDDETTEIEVNWPFGNKVIRFATVMYARQFMKRRFTNLLLPVPETFNLQVMLKTDVENLQNLSPVDPKCLNGTHICGSFGILDSRKLTPTLACTMGTTQEVVLQRLAERAQFLVRCRLRTLGLFLLPKDEQLEEVLDNVAHLSKLGGLEIAKLKAQEKVLLSTKKELIIKKQKNLKKYMDLLMILPEDRRLEQYAKFRQEFNADCLNDTDPNTSPESPKAVECIEIDDSDSEGNKSLERKETITVMEDSLKKQIVNMQPILASNILPQPSQNTSVESKSSRPVENFRLVKTSTGKLVLRKDNSGVSVSKTLSGMKLRISNNRVLDDTT